MPAMIDELFPLDLPHLDAVHCPKHSIRWLAYQDLAGADARKHASLVSYRIEPAHDKLGTVRVVETKARHGSVPLELTIRP